MLKSLNKLSIGNTDYFYKLSHEELTNMEIFNLTSHYSTLLDNNNIIIAQENILDFVKKSFIGIANLIIRVFNNFKTVISNLLSDFKRSELKAWHESNFMYFKKIQDIKWIDVKDLVINYPDKMNDTYAHVVDKMIEAFDTYDIENKATYSLNLIKNVCMRIKSEQEIKSVLQDKDIVTRLSIGKINKVHNELMKMFEGKKRDNTFKSFFPNVEIFFEVNENLLYTNKYYKQVESVMKTFNAITGKTDEIINILDSNNSKFVSNDDIKNLSDIVRDMALIFDYFGADLLRLHTVEHNFISILNLFKTNFT